jgi:biotin transport system substrate-specific component
VTPRKPYPTAEFTYGASPAVSTRSHARRFVVAALGITLFASLTFVGANIRIPLEPVPITLQTLFVLLAGAVLGSNRGSFSQLLYVGVGVAGAPVFADSLSGFAMLSGPTGGYLMGFVLAPLFIGRWLRAKDAFWWNALVFFCGSLIVLSLGVIHLTLFYTHDVVKALQVGWIPFIPGDLLKVFAATSIYRSYRAIRPLV